MAQERFGKFELLTKLARGGQAEIFLARHREAAGIERLLVIKRVLAHLAKDRHFTKMFLEEAKIAALLEHPNVVPLYDVGVASGSFYIAMPYITGLTIQTVLEKLDSWQIKLPLDVPCSIVAQALAGLHYAHTRVNLDGEPLNVIHCDVSPTNLMVDEHGRVVLLDFGIAKAGHLGVARDEGAAQGKVSYMSPEQVRGDDLDRRSDIFSIGIVLYELATRHKLFKQPDRLPTDGPIPDPRDLRPEMSDAVAEVLLRTLERDPNRRYQTADEMRVALEQAAEAARLDCEPAVVARYVNLQFEDLLDERRDLLRKAQRGELKPTSGEREGHRGFRWRLWIPLTLVLAAAAGITAYLLLRGPTLHGAPLRLGIAPYLPKDVLKEEFRPLIRYLERRTRRPFAIEVPASYHQTAEKLTRGDLDLADLPAYPYLLARRENKAIEIVAMVASAGASSYESYLVVKRDQRAKNIAAVRRKRVCYVDQTSTSGYLMVRVMVREAGFDPNTFFSATRFSGNHYQALRDLIEGRCDVAGVYSGAYLTANEKGIAVNNTRILAISSPLPYDVICARPGLPKADLLAVREALLKLNIQRETGDPTLGRSLRISGFVPPKPGSFSQLAAELERQQAEKR